MNKGDSAIDLLFDRPGKGKFFGDAMAAMLEVGCLVRSCVITAQPIFIGSITPTSLKIPFFALHLYFTNIRRSSIIA